MVNKEMKSKGFSGISVALSKEKERWIEIEMDR